LSTSLKSAVIFFVSALVILFLVPQHAVAQTFQHPGVLVSKAQLDFVKAQVNAHVEPFYTEFLNAQASAYGSKTYQILGPDPSGVNQCGSNSTPDYGCKAADSDATAAYVQALLWYITGDHTYANNSIAIMNQYSKTLKAFAGWSPGYPCPGTPPVDPATCSNGPVQAGWDATKWPRAAEIIRYSNAGWAEADIQAFSDMLKNVYQPVIYDGAGENGNWELAMIEGMMGIAVFNNDSDLFQHAQLFWSQRVPAYFYYDPIDQGTPAPFPRNTGSTTWNGQVIFDARVNGISQETCRDMKHAHYGISSALAAAETAHIQGVGLYESEEPRLLAGLEFNSGIDVQGLSIKGTTLNVASYICSNKHNAKTNNQITLGEGYTFVIGYNEFHNRLGQALPNTAQWIAQGVLPDTEPIDVGGHMTIFEPLTHYADAGEPAPDFTLSSAPSSQTVTVGGSTTYTITISSLNGYDGSVTLSMSSGLPAGATADFNPPALSGGSGSSTLTIATSGTTSPGNYTLGISAIDGTLNHSTSAMLVVVNPIAVTITANDQTMTFGGILPALSYVVTPNVALDTTPTCTSSANGSSVPGSYPGAITCSGAVKAGYAFTYVAGKMTVNAIAATITANDQAMLAGASVPTLTYTSSPSGISFTALPACTTTGTPASPAGTYPITCAGAASANYVFTYRPGTLTVSAVVSNPVPVIASLTPPNLKAASSSFTLAVTGTGFVNGSVVRWGGSDRTTTYVDSMHLTALISASDISSVGQASVNVFTPAPAGGVSPAFVFAIDSPANAPGAFTVTATTANLNVAQGQNTTLPISFAALSNGAQITATCLNLPTGASCSFDTITKIVTIATTALTSKGQYQITILFTVTQQNIAMVRSPISLATWLGFAGLPLGFFWMGTRQNKIRVTVLLGICLVLTLAGCGGGHPSTAPTNAIAQTSLPLIVNVN
jgi:hypothetical protein